MPARVGNAALPWLQQNASGGSSADGGSEISLKAFDDMLELYGGVLTICSLVALINYHRVKFPLPISLSLSGLMMSLVLVSVDAALSGHPIRSVVTSLLFATDFDEIILRFGVGFLMFASAMESDIRALRPHWGLVFLLSACGVIISVLTCAASSLAIFLGFGYYSTPPTIVEVLYCVLFGAIVSPTDAHHFVLEALEKSRAPESFAAIVVGEGLTNDALAVVMFSIVKSIVDSRYLESLGGCSRILNEEDCDELHTCEWHHDNGTSHSVCQTESEEMDIWAEIAKDILGGLFLGILFGWAFSLIMRRIRQPNINILLSITLVFDLIALANILGSSAAVACAAAGIFLRAFGLPRLERRSQEELDIVWKFFEEALSGIFFLLIGLAIITDDFSVKIFFASVIAIPVSLGARWLSVAFPIYSWNYFSDSERQRARSDLDKDPSIVEEGDKIPWSIVPTLTWGGIRGGSSVALALSLSPYEGRGHIFSMVYAVVLHSVIVQGLSLPRFLKHLFEKQNVSEGVEDDNEDPDPDGRLAWAAAEKDGLLADLSGAIDSSPLLAHMLEEQGISKEQLVAVSDAASSISSVSRRSASARDGQSHHSHTSGGTGGGFISNPVSPVGSQYAPSPPNSYIGENLHLPPRYQPSPTSSKQIDSSSRWHSAPSSNFPKISEHSLANDQVFGSPGHRHGEGVAADPVISGHFNGSNGQRSVYNHQWSHLPIPEPTNEKNFHGSGQFIAPQQQLHHQQYHHKPQQLWNKVRLGIRNGVYSNNPTEDVFNGQRMRTYAGSNSSGESFPSANGGNGPVQESDQATRRRSAGQGRKGKKRKRNRRRRKSNNTNKQAASSTSGES